MNSESTTRPVLEARHLKRHYPVRQGWFSPPVMLKALDGVSFSLSARQTLAIVGESGSGKTTLARLLTLIEPPTAGELRIDGLDPYRLDRWARRRLRTSVQMIFQDPYASLNPRWTIRSTIGEPLSIGKAFNGRERNRRVREMMARVGLGPEHEGRYPHMFSGGQRQRIAIARALMAQPKVVIADEPVSALDLSIRAQVLNLMLDLQEEFNLAYVLISHDLALVRHVAHDTMVMYLGRTMEQGPTRDIFARPRHPYTAALIAAAPRLDRREARVRPPLIGEIPSPLAPPSGCVFRTRCPHADDHCAAEPPALRPVLDRPGDVSNAGHLVACHHAERLELS